MLKPLVEMLHRPYMDNVQDIIGYNAVDESGEYIGKVKGYVLNGNGKSGYLIIDLTLWIIGKQVLFPVTLALIRKGSHDLILKGLTREVAENLPEYHIGEPIRAEYEADVVSHYFSHHQEQTVAEGSNDSAYTPIKMYLLEEKPIIEKHNKKIGDVKIRKIVETYIETIEVPLRVERLVIEPSDDVDIVNPEDRPPRYVSDQGPVSAQEEVITIPVFYEMIEVSKRVAVSEKVIVRKVREVLTKTVECELSREELQVKFPSGE